MNGQRWIATFIHDRDPGVTWFYDHATGESRLLFRPLPHLDPAVLAPMTPVAFPARDGLTLHAFLTLPVGAEPAGLPLVLVVHGGPGATTPGATTRPVQFLANRGYAVLQVNFRGSTGYGKASHHRRDRRVRRARCTTTSSTPSTGPSDRGTPTRTASRIFGGSYGGYAALVGVTFTPDVFAAAVDFVGISDLVNFLAHRCRRS